MDLSTEHWEGITPDEREALARQLPSGFTFQAIRSFRLAGRQHPVALYQEDHAAQGLPARLRTKRYNRRRPRCRFLVSPRL